MDSKTYRELAKQYGTPVLMVSKKQVLENYHNLKTALPEVELFYAVKANAYNEIIRTLAVAGASFDISTIGEIDTVQSCNITGDKCIYTHPIKSDEEIKKAIEFGVKWFVADNESELLKFKPYKDFVHIIVRISVQNPACLVNLSHKFGIPPEEAFDLIKKGKDLGLKIKGLSFHAGSQNESPLKIIEGLEYCRDICWQSASIGQTLELIDIGGGFPINYLTKVLPPSKFCQPINEYLERYFSGYKIVAEPGRYLCGDTTVLAATIKGKALRNGIWWYYLDDGVYGSFSGKIYDHAEYQMRVPRSGRKYNSVIAGPTCDSFDVIYENISIPLLEIGDILLFDSMGAYTNASASNFNGFEKTNIVMIK